MLPKHIISTEHKVFCPKEAVSAKISVFSKGLISLFCVSVDHPTCHQFSRLTAKWLLVPGEQVEAAPARRPVGVVAELAALAELRVAAEARASLEPVFKCTVLRSPSYTNW